MDNQTFAGLTSIVWGKTIL